jgi:hypothetical protein
MSDLNDIRALLQQARVALPSTTTPAASAHSSMHSEVCPPPVLERDSCSRRAPPAVIPLPPTPSAGSAQVASQRRDPRSEPPVRPPGAPAWLRISGRGARERYARGEGVCLWSGKPRLAYVTGVEGSPIDVQRVRAAIRIRNDRSTALPAAAGAMAVARSLVVAGIDPMVLGAAWRWLGRAARQRHADRAALRWLRKVCGRPIGLRALVAAWRKLHPEHWASARAAC